jgi:DNA-binding FadR family transcriptional regulator
MTPEQQANMQAACEAMKNIDMNKVMADAANAWQRAMVEAMKNEAKNQAVKGIKGLIKKPKIP